MYWLTVLGTSLLSPLGMMMYRIHYAEKKMARE
jgi:hypothetical protein